MTAEPIGRGAGRRVVAAVALAATGALACSGLGERPQAAPASPAPGDPPAFADLTKGLERREGLFDLYVDARRGLVWAALPAADANGHVGRYLYVEGLVSGLGSNPIGLDRGQLGPARILDVERVGGRVLFVLPNLAYRALSDDPAERRAVEESFARSVLWGGPVAAVAPDGRLLVDVTTFVVRDAHDVAGQVRRAGQGTLSLDRDRSAPDLDVCLAFPDNVVLEALLTFAVAEPGPEIEATAPLAGSVSVTVHQSLVRLPPDGYEPRPFDPRLGVHGIAFADYAAALDEPLEKRWMVRHRLQGPAAEPIVYYVDRGAPEPVRSALVEGASWWSEAFARAGFPGAFRVELLPEGAHPLDVRYDVVQWVHRATRGWSYGGGVIDPRTGEMIKGHVSLGSLRVRQDILLFEGLLGALGGEGSGGLPLEAALARIRQLAAHEVGHTLGLAHNFAASTSPGLASVMDYPAPFVTLDEGGGFDVSRAYGVGVGPWDVLAIRAAYEEPGPGESQRDVVERLAAEAVAGGLVFLGDADARPDGAAEPRANLWDNGADPAEELERLLAVRERAIERFGRGNIAAGRPLAQLQEVFVPVFLMHRYQLAAAAKLLGGVEYAHAVAGDGQPPATAVAAEAQRRALAALLAALEPERLDVPDRVVGLMLPRPLDHGPSRETFTGRAGPVFDPLGAAATAAEIAAWHLLQPERLLRLVDQHRRDPALPSLPEVLGAVEERVFGAPPPAARLEPVARAVEQVVAARLVQVAAAEGTAAEVRAEVEASLGRLAERLSRGDAHRRMLSRDLGRFLERPWEERHVAPAPPAPPGSPIGTGPDAAGTGCSAAAGW